MLSILENLFSKSNKGINDDNIKTIYNGIDWESWEEIPDGNNFRLAYPYISEKFVIFAGRLATNKGIPTLIEAISMGGDEFDLVLMGADMGIGKDLDKRF